MLCLKRSLLDDMFEIRLLIDFGICFLMLFSLRYSTGSIYQQTLPRSIYQPYKKPHDSMYNVQCT